MLVIDDNKRNLLNMKRKMLELSVGNMTENLDAYRMITQEIDDECYKTLVQKIKNSNYNNLPLEDQLKFFTEIIDDYNDIYNQQIIFKDTYSKYTDEELSLSHLNNILIDRIEERKGQIEGYLINIKNLKSNKIEIDRLNQALIAASNEKEKAFEAIEDIKRKLKNDVLKARGRIQNSNGNLEVTDVAIEFKKYDLNLSELLDNKELLDKVYGDAKRELDDVRETLDTALGLPNKDESICEKYMVDVLKSNYKFNLLELIKEVFDISNNYDLFKDSLYKIDDLLKEIKNNLKELKVKFYINLFDGIRIGEYIKSFEKFKDSDEDIANIKKTITYLTKLVADMEKNNNVAMLSINDEVTIFGELGETIYVDIKDEGEFTSEEDTTIYQLLKDSSVSDNQVIKIVNPNDDFMFGIVKQKTKGVINRVYEMLNHEDDTKSTNPDLIVEKKEYINNDEATKVDQVMEMPEMPIFEGLAPFDDSVLFEELPPFIEPQLFEERKDGDIFDDKKEPEMKIDLSDDKAVNVFREQLLSDDSNLDKKVNGSSNEGLFWISKEDNKVANLEDYKSEPLVKKRAA